MRLSPPHSDPARRLIPQAASNKETQAREQEKEQKTLEAKLKKRGDELARQRQRLVAVRGVRPAFMAEHEKLQEQLGSLFAEYLDRHRNLEYLQRRLGALEAQEEKDAEEDERRMRKAQVTSRAAFSGPATRRDRADCSGGGGGAKGRSEGE